MTSTARHLIVSLITGLLLVGCTTLNTNQSTTAPHTSSSSIETSANPELRTLLLTQTTLIVPETNFEVSFRSGDATISFGDHQQQPTAGYGTVTMLDQGIKEGEVIFSIIAVNYGGSGEVFYLVALEPAIQSNNQTWTMTDAAELGDRIKVMSLVATGPVITTSYLTHDSDQALYEAPNLLVTQVYTYMNQTLTQLGE